MNIAQDSGILVLDKRVLKRLKVICAGVSAAAEASVYACAELSVSFRYCRRYVEGVIVGRWTKHKGDKY